MMMIVEQSVNANWQGEPKCSEKTFPSATLSTTNPTWPDPGSNPGRRGGKPATNTLTKKQHRPVSRQEHFNKETAQTSFEAGTP
jgi:hypothetical protein